jgi:SPRY domain-containing SOCS box protein 3
MSKKEEDDEEQTMLVGKIYVGKKKSYQRRQWLEKRKRKRRKRSNIIDQTQKHRNVSNGGSNRSTVRSVPTSILPPLSWSSISLISHLKNEHHSNKNCLNSQWKWSKSTKIDSTTVLLDNNKRILFHPRTSSSTQVILADHPLPLNGKHYWEIYMPAVYGTSIMFGIASKLKKIFLKIIIIFNYLANEQQLISSSFTNLIGSDQHGWGLSHQGLLWHNGISSSYLSQPMETLRPILVGLEFDADARTLSYIINNQSNGIAFRGIPKNVLIYPAVSSTSAQSTMILKHCCKICSSLREICLKTLKTSGLRENINYQLLPRHLIEQLIK